MKTPWKPLPLVMLRKPSSADYKDEYEEFLLDFFDEPQSQKIPQIFDLLNSNPHWAVKYQLSEQRQHLLDWFPFDAQKSLLDIGAGCGALTGLFSEQLKKVTCLEPTPTRAEVIAQRWADRENVEVIVGSHLDIVAKEKYDYINVTGVLEYAGRFANESCYDDFEKKPEEFLQRIYSLLKHNGKAFIAIENSLGLRYLSGATEDHYGELFIGVENYATYNGIRTFSLSTLKGILEEIGFAIDDIYLPFPDYKLPTLVLNSNYLYENNNSLSSFFQNQEFSGQPLRSLFSEIGLAYQLQTEKILEIFANSYLIVARKN